MSTYCRSCFAGDEQHGEPNLCDECVALLRDVRDAVRAWADPDDDGIADTVRLAAVAARVGFDAQEIRDEAAFVAIDYGLAGEVRDLLADI